MHKHNLFLYCIKCERMEISRRKFETFPVVHADGVKDARVREAGYSHSTINGDECAFPLGWATCYPPELEPDWIEHVVPPSDEEMKLINDNSILLIADFVL